MSTTREHGGVAPGRRLRAGGPAIVVGLLLLPALAAASGPQAPPDRSGDRAGATLRPADGSPGARDPASAPSGPRFVPGEVIVGFRPGVAGVERAAVRDTTRTAVDERLPVPRSELLRIRGDRSPRGVARRLERLPEVAYAQPNYYRHATALPDDPGLDALWGLLNAGQLTRSQSGIAGADVSAEQAWDVNTGDPETVVAVVDTGVDATHPDLAANIVPGGWDFIDNDSDPSDLDGHGTHVAGTIGAVGDNGIGVAGVAWNVGLLPVRVLDENGNGTDVGIAHGLTYAAAAGARIVNASLGGEGASPVIDAAIADAPQTLFVVAAGNGGGDGVGDDNDATPIYPCNSPEPNVICVAATDNRDQLAGFSNFGATAVDLAAPGVDVRSTAAAGVYRELFFEGFEDDLAGRWQRGGNAGDFESAWDRVAAPVASGDWSIADSPAGDYEPDIHAWIDSPAIDLTGAGDCRLALSRQLDVAPGDFFVVDVTDDGFGDYQSFSQSGSFGWDEFLGDISDYDGAPEFQLGLRIFANDDVDVGDGAHVDDVSVVCVGSGPGYDFLSGTSMATPHVSGVAALVLAEVPDAPVAQLRDAILDSVDADAALTGVVATGGRLNAAAAVNAVPPRATITSGPSGLIADRRPVFEFTASKPGSFECRIDAATFAPCASGHQTGSLADGPHTFRVRSVNEHGAGTAEERSFTVDTTAPRVRLVEKPKRRGRKRAARFRFRADEAPVSFRCRIDRRLWRPCVSPRRYRVKRGRHVFRVQATDQLGHTGPVKRWKFRVRR